MKNNWKVTQNGVELDPSKYTWYEKKKTFSTNEDNLVLDFSEIDGVTFTTGSGCTFDTGLDCTFTTGCGCTFKTGSDCTFNTGCGCTFKTGSDCTFDTGNSCTFDTGWDCTFNTGSDCAFNTGSDCVVVRRDVFEFFTIPKNKKIKLNGYGEKGYTEVKEQ